MITRLNKYLSECGIASRRKSDELILEGRVQVNGSTVFELGTKINPDKDEVYVDGEKLKEQKKVYFLLNKPIGVITSTSDEKNRVTVVDLIKTKEKIFPVGRLDYNTSGVIMLTNDGEFSNYLTHPKNGIEREYSVKIDKPLELEDKEKLLKGIYLDNRKSKFTSVTFPKKNIFKLVNVTTVEGRNHFVKRMFDALGYGVNELSRIRYGKINVKNMKPGEYRIISDKEVKMLMK